MEASLLRAEAKWRNGEDSDDVLETDLSTQLQELERHWGEVRKRARPEPRTLGLESTLGLQPANSLAEDLRQLIESLREQPASGKEPESAKARTAKLEAFLERAKLTDERKLAWAVFQQAASNPRPSPEEIITLDGILRSRRREPRYLETLALRRAAQLAEKATTGGPQSATKWRPETVHGGLEVVRLAGLAENRPLPLSWVRPQLRDAAGSRQEAEIMLWEPGFSPPEATQSSLDLAMSRYKAVLSMQDTVEPVGI